MQFALDKVGQWSDEQDFKVEAERIKQYAAATNDPIPAHANGELAPPAFSFVVHGEQDMYFHKPIVPGAVLRSRAAPIGIHVKQSGTTVVSRMETRDETGQLVNEQYSVTF